MLARTGGACGRGYGRWAILRIIVCSLPSKRRCLRSFVTSDGMGGAVPSEDERGPAVDGSGSGYGYGYGAAGSVMTSSLGVEGEMGRARGR
jgi:hypothetical protein